MIISISHVLPSMIRKIHDAKVNNSKYLELWGTGKPKENFFMLMI
jgi:GDP-L-fucose synthase